MLMWSDGPPCSSSLLDRPDFRTLLCVFGALKKLFRLLALILAAGLEDASVNVCRHRAEPDELSGKQKASCQRHCDWQAHYSEASNSDEEKNRLRRRGDKYRPRTYYGVFNSATGDVHADRVPSSDTRLPTCSLAVTRCDSDLQLDSPISQSAVHQRVKESLKKTGSLAPTQSLTLLFAEGKIHRLKFIYKVCHGASALRLTPTVTANIDVKTERPGWMHPHALISGEALQVRMMKVVFWLSGFYVYRFFSADHSFFIVTAPDS
ncbi:hypothetical protein GBF38_004947 [Nibea albiflora]|uniref:Uncharacterized protein n=1 Tax=Nibea albiflora TaxID=240163 RepID=A0ACB7EYP5_NIBAL|nr:hypothetical protein GBF38_004947 [Nibea albiflora]